MVPVQAVDGKRWQVTVDRTDQVVRLQVGNRARLDDFDAQLSPSEARDLAAALQNAAAAVEVVR